MAGRLNITIPEEILARIQAHGERAYPEEGAGLMLGSERGGTRKVESLLFLENAREENARHNRYLITANDMLAGEKEALRQNRDILGIFHSHPDHPNQPSDFDREYAIPWYSYLITSVQQGKAVDSKCWRLKEDRAGFDPEEIVLIPAGQKENG